MTTVICKNIKRREQVRKHQELNGLDYLEVGIPDKPEPSLENQRVLTVYFLGKAPVELDKSNVRIEGGSRINDIRVEAVKVEHNETVEFDDYMEVSLNKPGDFSTYTLRVVERTNEEGKQREWQPHSAFDPRYDRIDFSFKVDCPSELDCKQNASCPLELLVEPDINYLAKDYASFRQLILDRFSLVMPDWKERHIPDIGIALIEVLAYVSDHLSYYQDAVATEAYLGTARKRISVRRHARLVDYNMHEGCNARAWLCVQSDTNLSIDPEEIYFITGFNETLQAVSNVLTEDDLRQIPSSSYEVFEPLESETIHIYENHSRMLIYTWGDKECCLPSGTTHTTLIGQWSGAEQLPEESPCDPKNEQIQESVSVKNKEPQQSVDADNTSPLLNLQPGDVLIFEEVKGAETGHSGDANPKHHHAVRLITVEAGVDKLNNNTPVVEISWAEEDALPFPLCISALGSAPECTVIENVSVVCGNIILLDHGKTQNEDLGTVPVKETVDCCQGEGVLADTSIIPGYYRPALQDAPLTFSQPLMLEQAASTVLTQDVRQALPQVSLNKNSYLAVGSVWSPRRDLFLSGSDDQHFVAEMDNEGRAHLRFGDGESGKKPQARMTFQASYRIGNGLAGNVGAEAITHIVSSQLSGANVSVRNPMPAQGGTAAESMEEVRLYAPHTFRKELQRAITADDYASIVQREFKTKVQRAAAKLRWTGSGYEILVAVDPYGQEQAGEELLDAISKRLHRYRRMGHDLVVKSALRVPLDIEIKICVLSNYLRGHIKAALLGLLSRHRLSDGALGFFHPDNLSFGEGVFLSHLVALIQAVDGVESVQVMKLQKLNASANKEIEKGVLPLGSFEIARLDNDPSFPENGALKLDMRGGR